MSIFFRYAGLPLLIKWRTEGELINEGRPLYSFVSVLHVQCIVDEVKSVVVWISVVHGKFVYIGGCQSREGEPGVDGIQSNFIQLPFTECNLQWVR